MAMLSNARKILVVDDNEDLCHMLRDVLELETYAVTCTHNGLDALEAVRNTKFHAVLLDVKLPEMNGVEVLRKVKEIAPDLPVIMITAFAYDDLLNEAFQYGARAALKKPFEPDELIQAIESCC